MKLGPWLELQKKANGLTRRQFAEKIGVTAQMITGYCDGTYVPGREVMPKIKKESFGAVTANDFYHDDTQGTESAA